MIYNIENKRLHGQITKAHTGYLYVYDFSLFLDWVTALTFSPDTKLLVSASNDKYIKVFLLKEENKLIASFYKEHNGNFPA